MELHNLQDNLVLVAALAALAGLIIGSLLTYLMIGRGPSKTELTSKLAAVEEEYKSHKSSVDEHFATTSELVNELTESYVKVYKHLSEGAEQLGGVVDMRHRLTLDEGKADSTSHSADENADGAIIEGALATASLAATTAGVTTVEATSVQADDPRFATSDEGVEESLSELEANATNESDLATADSPDAVADALTDIESGANVDSVGTTNKSKS